MNTKILISFLTLATAIATVAQAEDSGIGDMDMRAVLRQKLVAGTRVTVSEMNAGAGAVNQVVLTRNEPIRLKGAKPTRIDFIFVVNESLPPPDGRPADGIAPIIEEKVTRQISTKRDEWTERGRANAAREFGNVPVRVEETLYGDLTTHESARLVREGYVEKTLITFPDSTTKMKLFVREVYAPRDAREVRAEVTFAFAPRLVDDANPDGLGVFIGARTTSPANITVTTGTLADLDAKHLQQFQNRVAESIDVAVNWFNKNPPRHISLQKLVEERAADTPLTIPLSFLWFGESHRVSVASLTPPRRDLPVHDFTEEWGTPR